MKKENKELVDEKAFVCLSQNVERNTKREREREREKQKKK